MNIQRKVAGALLACVATAIPVCAAASAADDRAALLREMARTDGNPFGENAIPQPSKGDVAKLTREQIAFFHEMARTDGNVAPRPAETPAEPAIASR